MGLNYWLALVMLQMLIFHLSYLQVHVYPRNFTWKRIELLKFLFFNKLEGLSVLITLQKKVSLKIMDYNVLYKQSVQCVYGMATRPRVLSIAIDSKN